VLTLNKYMTMGPGQDAACERAGWLPAVSFCFCLERFLRRQLEEYELVARQSPSSKDMNAEVMEATGLEAATRRQPVKIQQTEKTSYVLQ
jgi:hypothetical protein